MISRWREREGGGREEVIPKDKIFSDTEMEGERLGEESDGWRESKGWGTGRVHGEVTYRDNRRASDLP